LGGLKIGLGTDDTAEGKASGDELALGGRAGSAEVDGDPEFPQVTWRFALAFAVPAIAVITSVPPPLDGAR